MPVSDAAADFLAHRAVGGNGGGNGDDAMAREQLRDEADAPDSSRSSLPKPNPLERWVRTVAIEDFDLGEQPGFHHMEMVLLPAPDMPVD